jgi:hypothetical protein
MRLIPAYDHAAMAQSTIPLANLGNVPTEYQHYPKLITPAEDLILPQAHLKWYDVRRGEAAIDANVRLQAREFLRSETGSGRLNITGELGFAILHLCGESFFFLIVCTWRNANEMWETVYTFDRKPGGQFQLVPQGTHMEVICVWELGAVLHERAAWTRYLYSVRDEQAKIAYLEDRFTGTA